MRALLLGLVVIVFVAGAVALIANGRSKGEPTAAPGQPTQVAQHALPTATPAHRSSQAAEIPQPTQPRPQPTATSTRDAGDVGSPIPQNALAAAALFGGEADDWQAFEVNGWIFRSSVAAALSVPAGWRIDYTAPSGAIFSCGDVHEPGQYGPLQVVTSAATLWYVPGETACPAWSIWSQVHGA